MRTDEEIKDDIFAAIKGSSLENEVSGKLSKKDRPINSNNEDIVISILANQNDQIQKASVNINIYVSDKAEKVGGLVQYAENTIRLKLLSRMVFDLLENYVGQSFYLKVDSQRVLSVSGKQEHFINTKVYYQCFNN